MKYIRNLLISLHSWLGGKLGVQDKVITKEVLRPDVSSILEENRRLRFDTLKAQDESFKVIRDVSGVMERAHNSIKHVIKALNELEVSHQDLEIIRSRVNEEHDL